MTKPLLTVPDLNCARCGGPTLLAARLRGKFYCNACWIALRQPWPDPCTPEEVEQATGRLENTRRKR